MITLKDIAELGIDLAYTKVRGDIYESAAFRAIDAQIHAVRQEIIETLDHAVGSEKRFVLIEALDQACNLKKYEVERVFYKIGYTDAMRALMQGLTWEPDRERGRGDGPNL